MKRIAIAVCAVVLVFAVASMAQTPAPQPGPEHQKLAGLVGSWTTEGEVNENPLGPAEKWSGKITSEWFSGNFAVVRHVDEKYSVSGEDHTLEVIAYDGTAKTYTWYAVDNQGWTGLAKASISGDVLTAVWEIQAKGKTYKVRGTLKGLGSDRLTYMQDYSEDGTAWKTYLHSTDTRVKSK
jgi:hypothetical protein